MVYAALWQQQQSFIEGGAFGGTGGGIFKSTDGGTTWRQLTDGLPPVIRQISRSRRATPRSIYAMVAGGAQAVAEPRSARPAVAADAAAAERCLLQVDGCRRALVSGERRSALAETGSQRHPPIPVRWSASAAATCRPSPSTRRTRTSSTARSTVMWRTEDGGLTWSAVRGAPGGDDYQKTWINPEQSRHHPCGHRSGRRSLRQPRRLVEQLVHPANRRHVSRHHRQRVPVSAVRRAAGLGLGLRREPSAWTARSRSTIGIRSTSRSTAKPRPTRRTPTSSTAAK